jgi:carbon storage regulator CsrA
MLVLSRRPHEKILIPSIHATIRVAAIRPGVVRVAIEAPRDVTILRGELEGQSGRQETAVPTAAGTVIPPLTPILRQVSEHLKAAGVGVGLGLLQLDAGLTPEAKATLARIRDDLRLLRYGVDGEAEQTPHRPIAAPPCAQALLVEDDRNERELLAGFLRRSGLVVQTAGDGADALDYLRSGARPDVVLLDMGLPRCDGATTVREIRRDPALAGLKVFAVTGYLPEEFDLPRGPSGIDRWFHKPLDPNVLLGDLTRELESAGCRA